MHEYQERNIEFTSIYSTCFCSRNITVDSSPFLSPPSLFLTYPRPGVLFQILFTQTTLKMLFPSTSLVLCVGLLVSGIQAAPLKKVESFDLEGRAPIEPLLGQRDLLSSTVYEHERRDLDEFDLELRDFEDDLLERRDFEPELELRDLEFDDLERRDDETVSFERRDDSHLSELEKRAGGNAAVASKAWSVGKSLFNRVVSRQFSFGFMRATLFIP
ncbi:hypothetical protein M408DRAFT_141421 [Serendipita vermifera MAFF 305830]|uniref:Uncharacterized protein n=1 Tax=Serendipita vermifera MAFF 305830 TaxID=933852 RepID=A0A0C3BAG2_SERVB|nr:hypothetical protein M408DRAFT_141421 [Serendipita vermifera MAFF 305830]